MQTVSSACKEEYSLNAIILVDKPGSVSERRVRNGENVLEMAVINTIMNVIFMTIYYYHFI